MDPAVMFSPEAKLSQSSVVLVRSRIPTLRTKWPKVEGAMRKQHVLSMSHDRKPCFFWSDLSQCHHLEVAS